MPQIVRNHAIVQTTKGNRFVLLKYSTGGFSRFDTYRLYSFDKQADKEYITITVFRTRLKKYAPYIFNNMSLISFGISFGLIFPYKDITISESDLDNIYKQFRNSYNKGAIDSQLLIGP